MYISLTIVLFVLATIIYNRKLLICAYLYDDVSEDIRQVYQDSITGNSFLNRLTPNAFVSL